MICYCCGLVTQWCLTLWNPMNWSFSLCKIFLIRDFVVRGCNAAALLLWFLYAADCRGSPGARRREPTCPDTCQEDRFQKWQCALGNWMLHGPRESQELLGDWMQMSKDPDGKTSALSRCLELPLPTAPWPSDTSVGNQDEEGREVSQSKPKPEITFSCKRLD